jgi:hypothetical protein
VIERVACHGLLRPVLRGKPGVAFRVAPDDQLDLANPDGLGELDVEFRRPAARLIQRQRFLQVDAIVAERFESFAELLVAVTKKPLETK